MVSDELPDDIEYAVSLVVGKSGGGGDGFLPSYGQVSVKIITSVNYSAVSRNI